MVCCTFNIGKDINMCVTIGSCQKFCECTVGMGVPEVERLLVDDMMKGKSRKLITID